MGGQLVTLPLRVSALGARLFFRAAEEVAGRAMLGAVQVVSAFTRRGSADAPSRASAEGEPRAPRQQPRAQSAPTAERARPAPAPAEGATATVERPPEVTEPAIAQTPAHVSEEPELVQEFAEPGAEEGAGAEVTVLEPWQGYGRMSAKEVIARLADATPAELAAVALYESGHRSRQTVLEAVQRQLRAANGRGSQN